MDAQWWFKHYDELQSFKGARATAASKIPGVETVKLLATGNSGIGAMMLAEQLCAQKIILVGYDCQYADNGKRHWHADHPLGLGNAGSLDKWPAQFKKAAQILSHIEVINASRQTALDCWPRMDLEQALND